MVFYLCNADIDDDLECCPFLDSFLDYIIIPYSVVSSLYLVLSHNSSLY